MMPLQIPEGKVDLAATVRAGLTSRAKKLPPVLFYDAEGSALFDEITTTPEYYLTRTEQSIFDASGPEMLAAAARGRRLQVVELGAGSATKTATLLRQLLTMQESAEYFPIDVSAAPIEAAATRLTDEMPTLRVRPIVGRNRAGLGCAPRENDVARLILYIGSSIGNYEPDEAAALLRDVGRTMAPGDALLLGTDLHKDEDVLHAAYNDAAGVTARFNLNVLARMNRELGADFDLDSFQHVAFYNAEKRRIEMHIESLRTQNVAIPKADLTVRFREGERIHTENSYKYTYGDVERLAHQAGLARERTWTDPQGWFGVHLIVKRP